MLIDLSTYLDELKVEKVTIEQSSDEEKIKELVAEFEERTRAEFAEEKARKLKEKEIEIDVLERIVAREAKKEEEQPKAEIVSTFAPAEPEAEAVTTDILAEPTITSVEENQSDNNDFADL